MIQETWNSEAGSSYPEFTKEMVKDLLPDFWTLKSHQGDKKGSEYGEERRSVKVSLPCE